MSNGLGQKDKHKRINSNRVEIITNSEGSRFSVTFSTSLIKVKTQYAKITLPQPFCFSQFLTPRSPAAAFTSLAFINSAASEEKGFWRVAQTLLFIYNSNVMILRFKGLIRHSYLDHHPSGLKTNSPQLRLGF